MVPTLLPGDRVLVVARPRPAAAGDPGRRPGGAGRPPRARAADGQAGRRRRRGPGSSCGATTRPPAPTVATSARSAAATIRGRVVYRYLPEAGGVGSATRSVTADDARALRRWKLLRVGNRASSVRPSRRGVGLSSHARSSSHLDRDRLLCLVLAAPAGAARARRSVRAATSCSAGPIPPPPATTGRWPPSAGWATTSPAWSARSAPPRRRWARSGRPSPAGPSPSTRGDRGLDRLRGLRQWGRSGRIGPGRQARLRASARRLRRHQGHRRRLHRAGQAPRRVGRPPGRAAAEDRRPQGRAAERGAGAGVHGQAGAGAPVPARRPGQPGRAGAAARGRASGPIPVVTDFICPVRGPLTFTDSWGAPRSGGRRHEGTDIMNAHGTENVAVVSGTFETHHSGPGGCRSTSTATTATPTTTPTCHRSSAPTGGSPRARSSA